MIVQVICQFVSPSMSQKKLFSFKLSCCRPLFYWWLHTVTTPAAPHVVNLYSSFSSTFPFICFLFWPLFHECLCHTPLVALRSRVSIQAMAQSLFVGDAKTACLQYSALQPKALLQDQDHHAASPETLASGFLHFVD